MVFPYIPIKVFHGRMDVLTGYDVLDRYWQALMACKEVVILTWMSQLTYSEWNS